MQEEEQKLVDMDQVARVALERVESSGIIFWTRSTRSPGANRATAPTFRVKECSATSCP